MDSVNSGSMQSSSCGDEEFDSRAESISSFFTSSGLSSSHVGSMSSNHQQPQPPHHPHPSSSSLFDPLSPYLDAFGRPSPIPSSSMVWPNMSLRSEPNCTQPAGGLMGPSPSTQPIPGFQQGSGRAPNFLINPSSSSVVPPVPENATRPSTSSDPTNAVKNPKKRSRASRRAPTTVLTTDTSNFRAMVQEFTGIPAPPFSASPFPRSRLDLFGTASSTTMRSGLDPTPPSYLLRPFAHKLQPPAFVSPSALAAENPVTSSSTNIIAATTTTTTNNPTISTAITATPTLLPSTNVPSNSTASNSNYQLPSELGLPKQAQNLVLNMQSQHPMLSFQSLLQSPSPHSHQKQHPSISVPIFGMKSQVVASSSSSSSLTIPSSVVDSRLKVGLMEELGGGGGGASTAAVHHLGTGLHNLASTNASDGLISLRSNDNWGEGVGSNDGDQGHHHHHHLRSFSGNYGNSQRVSSSSCKMNFSASSADFHADKGSENVPSRGEGMVDSWICPSD